MWLIRWIGRLFFKKNKEVSKRKPTKEEVDSRAVWSCQMVALTGRYIGAGYWEEIDTCSDAMQMFMKDCPYCMGKGDLTRAAKTIKKYKWMMLSGKVV